MSKLYQAKRRLITDSAELSMTMLQSLALALGQTQVNVRQAPAVAGDWADANPRSFYLAGPGGLVAGPSGVTPARFAWASVPHDWDGTPAIINNFGSGPVAGLVHREQQALITQYLSSFSNLIQQGQAMALCISGSLWMVNDGAAAINNGDVIYADFATGKASNTLGGATASAWGIAAATATFTGSISGDVLTAGVVTGTVYPGSLVTGAGVTTGTRVVKQLSGVTGAAGTYLVDRVQTAASTAITLTYGLLTLTTVTAGTFANGDTLTGASAGVVTGTAIISAPITGAGGSGSTFAVNNTQTSGNGGQGVLTAATNVATKWIAASQAAAGEIFKCTSHLQG